MAPCNTCEFEPLKYTDIASYLIFYTSPHSLTANSQAVVMLLFLPQTPTAVTAIPTLFFQAYDLRI